MAMVVKNNMSAVNTLNVLNANSAALAKDLQHVATGMKVNSAADDNSGYAISERMQVRIRALNQADQNTQNGANMLKVAEGAVSSTVDILKTMKEKAINAANDSNTDADRATIQKELDQSIDQIDDNALVTYNGKYLVDGSKNSAGAATYTALTNKSLAADTQTGTSLTDLKNRNGEKLGILSTDSVTVSYVQDGKTYTTSFLVGTACLHDIFVNAEAIDPTTQTFADQTNSSVATASGLGVSTSIQQLRDSLYNAWQQAEANLVNAQNAVNAQQTVVNNAQSAVDSVQGTITRLTNQQIAVNNTYNALSSAVTSNTKTANISTQSPYMTTQVSLVPAGLSLQFNNWAGNSPNTAVAATPDPSQLSINNSNQDYFYTVANNGGTSSSQTYVLLNSSDFTGIQNAWSSYTSAYSTYAASSYTSLAGATSYGDTALAAANGDLTTVQSTLNTETATLNGLKSNLSTAKSAAVTARNNYNALFGPYLLTGENIGVDRSGDTVRTADGKNAVTVTANGTGISGQIAGFTVSVSDSKGNVKKSVNAVLDAWTETIRAENKSEDNAITLQMDAKANQTIRISLTDMRSEALGLKSSDGVTLSVATQKNANAAVNVLDNAIQKALNQQTDIGAVANRMEQTSNNLHIARDNVQASESTIRDADMAKAMTSYTKNNILLQAAQSMLAQANQSGSNVLSLLQ